MTSENHAASMAKAWSRIKRVKLSSFRDDGSNPVELQSMNLRDVDHERRINCARLGGCLTYAAKMGWRSFTCARCGVREDIKHELPLRHGSDEVANWPVTGDV